MRTSPHGGRYGDASVNGLWMWVALLGPPIFIVIWALVSHEIDKAKYGRGGRGQGPTNGETPEEIYIRYESYNHYEEGDYR